MRGAGKESSCHSTTRWGSPFSRKRRNGAAEHTQREHNLSHYLYLIAYIEKKPVTEYTGTESLLHEQIDMGDPTFIPVYRAMTLTESTDKKDVEMKESVAGEKSDAGGARHADLENRIAVLEGALQRTSMLLQQSLVRDRPTS